MTLSEFYEVLEYSSERLSHTVRSYRSYILGVKRKFGTARNQIHYHELIRWYLVCKQELGQRGSDGKSAKEAPHQSGSEITEKEGIDDHE